MVNIHALTILFGFIILSCSASPVVAQDAQVTIGQYASWALPSEIICPLAGGGSVTIKAQHLRKACGTIATPRAGGDFLIHARYRGEDIQVAVALDGPGSVKTGVHFIAAASSGVGRYPPGICAQY